MRGRKRRASGVSKGRYRRKFQKGSGSLKGRREGFCSFIGRICDEPWSGCKEEWMGSVSKLAAAFQRTRVPENQRSGDQGAPGKRTKCVCVCVCAMCDVRWGGNASSSPCSNDELQACHRAGQASKHRRIQDKSASFKKDDSKP